MLSFDLWFKWLWVHNTHTHTKTLDREKNNNNNNNNHNHNKNSQGKQWTRYFTWNECNNQRIDTWNSQENTENDDNEKENVTLQNQEISPDKIITQSSREKHTSYNTRAYNSLNNNN